MPDDVKIFAKLFSEIFYFPFRLPKMLFRLHFFRELFPSPRNVAEFCVCPTFCLRTKNVFFRHNSRWKKEMLEANVCNETERGPI